MIRVYLTIFLFIIVRASASAYSSGPPDGRTGAPGEQTCQDLCHSTFPLNSGDGSFTITGPEFFEAGQLYTLTVEIEDPDQSRWGFEITPLDIGAVVITDLSNTQFSSVGNKSYVKHTSAGTFAGTPNGPVSWTFDWIAPNDAPPEVTFYAAGNGADNNGFNTDDYIYTTTFTTVLMTSGIGDDPSVSLPSHLSINNYPNPFNSQTTISFNLPISGRVSLGIYNINGQLVETLMNETCEAGDHSIIWYTGDLSSGLYFYKLAAGKLTSAGKMTLIK